MTPRYVIVCRAQVDPDCYHGSPTARQFDEDLPMDEDGTYDGSSIVCDACYIALGTPLNADLPAAIARARGRQ